MNRGAWRATVHRVTQSQVPLKWLSSRSIDSKLLEEGPIVSMASLATSVQPPKRRVGAKTYLMDRRVCGGGGTWAQLEQCRQLRQGPYSLPWCDSLLRCLRDSKQERTTGWANKQVAPNQDSRTYVMKSHSRLSHEGSISPCPPPLCGHPGTCCLPPQSLSDPLDGELVTWPASWAVSCPPLGPGAPELLLLLYRADPPGRSPISSTGSGLLSSVSPGLTCQSALRAPSKAAILLLCLQGI